MFRRSILCFVAVVSLNSLVVADDKDEWKALAGTWKIEKAIFMGTDSTEIFKVAVLTIEGTKFTVVFNDQTDKGTLAIDSAKKPKRMTVKGTEGPNKDKAYEAIYELKDDTLTVCYSLEGTDPPKEFESKEGTMTLLATYKRVKK